MLNHLTNNKLGLLLILLSFLLFPLSNVATRYITYTSSIPLSIYFVYVKIFAVIILFNIGLVFFGKSFFSVKNKKFVAIRCLILVINNICLTIALSYLPLDIFYSIVFIMPLITTVMGIIILKEKFTYINFLALTIGFVGIMVIVQPNVKETLGLIGVICSIITAITGSSAAIIARKYLPNENPYTANFYVAICSFALGLIMLINSEAGFTFAIEYLSFKVIIIIFLSALFTILASTLYMRAFQISNATIIAPAQYTQIIWGFIFGYLVFNDKTTMETLLGCAIIIFATLLNFYASKKGDINEITTK